MVCRTLVVHANWVNGYDVHLQLHFATGGRDNVLPTGATHIYTNQAVVVPMSSVEAAISLVLKYRRLNRSCCDDSE